MEGRSDFPLWSRRSQHVEVSGALRNRNALRNPSNRARIAASAATAGWHNGRDGGNGWWRHGHGGYGWVGPLYWPFAYYDMYDYSMWGYGYDDSFWDYGYGDIYAALFAPMPTTTSPLYARTRQCPPGTTGSAPPASGYSGRRNQPTNANVRRGYGRHRWLADRSIPASHPAD